MEQGLVSVVVPIYNVERYLERCLNSIVNQTYRKLEIILVDDGSTDSCAEICDDWALKDSRICVIHKKNAGLGMARNTGIENATGEYICFLDSDDYVDTQAVEKAYTLAKKEKTDVVIYGLSDVDKDGNIFHTYYPQTDKIVYCDDEIENVFLPDLIDPNNHNVKVKNLCLSACVCLFSMELVQRIKWRFVSERTIISEDSYAIISLYKYVKRVAVLCEPLYFYCKNFESLTKVYRADRFKKIKHFYYECRKMAEQLGFNEEVHNRISGLFLSFSIAAMKLIGSADLDVNDKKKYLAQIVDDDDIQNVLKNIDCRSMSKGRKILFWAVRNKKYSLVYLLARSKPTKS